MGEIEKLIQAYQDLSSLLIDLFEKKKSLTEEEKKFLIKYKRFHTELSVEADRLLNRV